MLRHLNLSDIASRRNCIECSPRTALVTGASRGIGLALARRLATDRWNLVLVARSELELTQIADSLSRDHGIHAIAIVADVASPQSANAVYRQVTDSGIAIDLLVNSAGIGCYGETWLCEADSLRSMVALNVGALTDLVHLFLPDMIERRRGMIANIASTAAFRPSPMMAAYGASKAYVLHFTESLACELEGTGVKALAICPGQTKTTFRQTPGMRTAPRGDAKHAATAEAFADFAVESLTCSRTVVIQGSMNRVSAFCMSLMPRAWQGRLVRWYRRRAALLHGKSP